MGINGINDYSTFLQNYKVPTIKSVSIEDVQQQMLEKTQENTPISHGEASVTGIENRPIAKELDLEDISITFNKQEDFDYLGKDSDVSHLDMDKAISDMQKDRLLQQYQYFVGNNRNIYPDGVVIAK